jgi:hypothetical protein
MKREKKERNNVDWFENRSYNSLTFLIRENYTLMLFTKDILFILKLIIRVNYQISL